MFQGSEGTARHHELPHGRGESQHFQNHAIQCDGVQLDDVLCDGAQRDDVLCDGVQRHWDERGCPRRCCCGGGGDDATGRRGSGCARDRA